jgi:hypothetical protein
MSVRLAPCFIAREGFPSHYGNLTIIFRITSSRFLLDWGRRNYSLLSDKRMLEQVTPDSAFISSEMLRRRT